MFLLTMFENIVIGKATYSLVFHETTKFVACLRNHMEDIDWTEIKDVFTIVHDYSEYAGFNFIYMVDQNIISNAAFCVKSPGGNYFVVIDGKLKYTTKKDAKKRPPMLTCVPQKIDTLQFGHVIKHIIWVCGQKYVLSTDDSKDGIFSIETHTTNIVYIKCWGRGHEISEVYFKFDGETCSFVDNRQSSVINKQHSFKLISYKKIMDVRSNEFVVDGVKYQINIERQDLAVLRLSTGEIIVDCGSKYIAPIIVCDDKIEEIRQLMYSQNIDYGNILNDNMLIVNGEVFIFEGVKDFQLSPLFRFKMCNGWEFQSAANVVIKRGTIIYPSRHAYYLVTQINKINLFDDGYAILFNNAIKIYNLSSHSMNKITNLPIGTQICQFDYDYCRMLFNDTFVYKNYFIENVKHFRRVCQVYIDILFVGESDYKQCYITIDCDEPLGVLKSGDKIVSKIIDYGDTALNREFITIWINHITLQSNIVDGINIQIDHPDMKNKVATKILSGPDNKYLVFTKYSAYPAYGISKDSGKKTKPALRDF